MPKPVTSLQWGHGEFAVDDPVRALTLAPPASRFNGATANSPWMTAPPRVQPRGRACFNGATANSPWMTLDGNGRQTVGLQASMGPRRIRRG